MPKIMELLKLGVEVKDKYSKERGVLTHVLINKDMTVRYYFKPLQVNEEGKLIDSRFTLAEDVLGGEVIRYKIPIEVLGTKAKHPLHSIYGDIVQIEGHLNGCLHVWLKPYGMTKNKKALPEHNFYLHELEGASIKKDTVDSLFPYTSTNEKKPHHPSPGDSVEFRV